MPKRYRLLVTDLDGTLIDRNGHISDEDKRAIADARSAGIQVAVCTGRAVEASSSILPQLGLDGYHIFFDGALVCNPDASEEVYADPIDKALVKEMTEDLQGIDISMDMYSSTRYFIRRVSWATEIRRTFYGLEPIITDFSTLWERERIIKGTLVVRSPEEKAKAKDYCARLEGRLKFSYTKTPAYPDVDFINVLAVDVSKGAALEALANFLGIPLSEVASIGDGANDIPLVAAAGLGIAMGNASAELKAVADYVTLDVDHSGVAAAIRKCLL